MRQQGVIPKWDVIYKIAEALDVSPITAFRKAGLLPPEGGEHSDLTDMYYLLQKLPRDEQEEVGTLIQIKYKKYKK